MILGCAEQPADNAPLTPPALTPAALTPGQSVPADPVATKAVVTHTTSTSVTPTPTVGPDDVAVEYVPPFPDRVDLFVPPKRAAGATAEADRHNSVELMGFVRVDHQRVVLSIDGNVASIPVGETQFGVHVLSINPPKVELQRGRQRWHATLE